MKQAIHFAAVKYKEEGTEHRTILIRIPQVPYLKPRPS
jgi:hypothetical protein